MRILKVTGIGTKHYPVNVIKIYININFQDKEYQKVLDLEKETFNYLKDSFKEDLKTLNYRVNQYTQYNNIDNKVEWTGYQIVHECFYEFEYNFEELGEVLDVMSHTPHQVEFSLQYDNNQINQDELKELAVKDAIHQAQILSQAAGVELKEIVNISTSQSERIVYESAYKSRAAMDFNEIKSETEVYMEWEIK